ncbi:hypothetical protein LPJ59_005272 [Coemansia sp. RSA 2399]|nr:hypothetical protein LPJ59_005272 [Coemansia sp. RSA 2399]KAJ1894749.1 hypothetical protein LPJ81_005100 [Coemansia sp. IMI 209127]
MAQSKISTNTTGSASTSNDGEETLWYLGYGANMSSKVLSGRRQVFPKESCPVVVQGYQLTFDMAGLPYWEPGFGTLSPVDNSLFLADEIKTPSKSDTPLLRNSAKSNSRTADTGRASDCQVGAPLHCVAHLITRSEMNHIINTEGGSGNPDFGYQVIEVECKTYDGRAIVGETLIDSKKQEARRHPSPRYHKILLDGAVEHGLAAEYVERLSAVVPYSASTAGQKTAKWTILVIGLPLALPMIIVNMAALIFKIKVPRLVATYGEKVKRLLWTLHDRVFSPIFGAGC